MKSILNFLLFLFVLGNVHAQAPQGITYQAAARNSSGAVLAGTPISVRFTIRDAATTGTILYRETHSMTTDANGMFSVNVGLGTPVSGNFASINWGLNTKFMQVELDPAGGSSYIDMGTQQMMSVPYALNAGAIKHTVSTTGDTLYSGGGNFIIIPGISAANATLPGAGKIISPVNVCVGTTLALSNTISGGVWSSSATDVATIGSTGIVTGISPGSTIISYTITNSFGTATTTLMVSVNLPLSVDIITGTATACAGSTTILSNTTTGGIWSSSATGIATVGSTGIVSGVSGGTATISYTVTNKCGSNSATRIVTINALPSAGTITGANTVPVGLSSMLSNANIGGIWSSSATSIATVSSGGILTGVSVGTTTISYTFTDTCGSAVSTRVVTVTPASAGVSYGGGIIAYILQPGDPAYVAGETHGIIAAPSDQSTGIQWGCEGTFIGGTSTALGTGAANTAIVSAACGAGTAARLCADLVLNGYSDWYLPSLNELQKLYTNRGSIGGFAIASYWSSSEASASYARYVHFNTGYTTTLSKNNTYYVRAVRSF
jgi:hypothetical protein